MLRLHQQRRSVILQAVLVMMYIAMGRSEMTHAYTYRLAVFDLFVYYCSGFVWH